MYDGDLLLRIRRKADDRYRYALVVGYGIFYTFLICTTDSPIAFTYILPVVSLLVLYKDRKFMVGCAIANIASVIISVIYHLVVLGQNTATDQKNYQLQIACLLLCYIGFDTVCQGTIGFDEMADRHDIADITEQETG